MKYIVECQTLIKYEIEADSKEQAENIAAEKVDLDCMYEADGIDWCISAYEQRSEGDE